MWCLASLITSLAVFLIPINALSAPAPNIVPLIKKAMQSPGTPILNPARTVDEKARLRVNKNYGKLPLRFEKNEGQTDEKVEFLSRGNGYSMYLTPTEAVMVLSKTAGGKKSDLRNPEGSRKTTENRRTESSVIRMKLIGSNPDPKVYGQNEQITKSNYLIGNDSLKWKTGVSNFGKVKYEEVYPGIDLVFYGNQNKLEYDFIVKPGADPGIISFEFEGEDSIAVDWDGNLRLETAIGEIVERAPIIYQNAGEQRKSVEGKYVLADNKVSFELSDYDREQELIIDPVLEYSTFLGGSGPDQDRGLSIAIDGAGNAYVAGFTYAPDFPTTSGAPDNSFGGTIEGFVSKLNPDGTTLSYSTFLGGSDQDVALSLALDALGNAYVVGYTSSNDFPTTPGAYQSPILGGPSDVFIAKINPTGTALVYSALLGGSDFDYGAAITVDTLDNAYVTGHTRSSNFPTTPGAIQNSIIGAGSMVFVTKLNAAGTGLEYSTLLGGETPDTATSIVVDASGNAYVTGYTGSFTFPTTLGAFDTSLSGGYDCFVSKLNATGTALIYSTYLGGSLPDNPYAMAIDASGHAYITGFTNSNDFPTTAGAFDETFNAAHDAFVTKLNASGTALDYSTYIGGAQVDVSESIAVDGSGNAYITGHTGSDDFPVTQGALDILFGGGFGDVFVTKINTTGTDLDFSTYLGDSEQDAAFAIALDALGNGYVTGRTRSNNFPITPGVFQSSNAGGNGDAFVSKINFAIPDSIQRNDFDGDGDSDLLLVNQDGTLVSVLIQDSVYQSHGIILQEDPAQGWTVNSTGDINGDKKADILLYNTVTGEYRLVTMDGTTVLTDNVLFSIVAAVGVEPKGMGDFDGNGEDEVLLYQPSTGIVALAFLAGGAFSSFEIVTTLDVANNWTLIDAADFTQDSKTDLLTQNTVTGETTVIEMDGSTPVATTSLFTIDPAAGLTNEDTADFNADGKTDILMLHTSGALVVIEMDNTSFQSIHVAGGLQLNEELVNAGIYDGDNKSDFLFHDTATGEVISGIQDGVTIIILNTVLNHLGPASGWTFHGGH